MAKVITTELQHSGASGANITLDSSKNVTFNGTVTGDNDTKPFRNLIINGAMNIAQKGTSSTSTGYQTVDRFRLDYSGHDEALTQAQHALTSSDTGPWEKGFRQSLHITNGNQTSGAGAGDQANIGYLVEAQDLANSGWDYTSASSYITLSFWVKSSVAQTFYGYIQTHDGTSQSYSISTGALSANTWTKVTKKIPGNSNIQIDNNNEKGMSLWFLWQYAGGDRTTSGHTLGAWQAYSNSDRMPDNTSTWWTTNDATFEVTGVQLEVGETATDFEHRSYADELQRCKRYFNMIVDPSTDTYSDDKGRQPFMQGLVWHKDNKDCRFRGTFNVPMRASPSLYKVVGTAWFRIQVVEGVNTTSDWTLLGSWKEFFELKCTAIDSFGSDDAGMSIYAICFNSGARIGWDAEL